MSESTFHPRPRAVELTRSLLSPTRRRLLAEMQRGRFGRIRRLRIRGGEPDWREGVCLVRTVKVTGENDPHPALAAADFALKREIAELLRQLVALGEGEICNLEFRNGLPFTYEVEEHLAG